VNLQQIKDRINLLLELDNTGVKTYQEVQNLVQTLVQEVLKREEQLNNLKNDSE